MGLKDLWLTAATARVHVLVAQTPGAFGQRVALERALASRGWCAAESVADADLLAVVGEPGPELTELLEHAWAQMSEPRARIVVASETEIAHALDTARATLRDTAVQRLGAQERPGSVAGRHDAGEHEDGGHEHGGDEHGGDEHGGDEHGGDEHGGDERGEHHHAGMSPDGIPVAEGAEDRDGLEMDELHLPLGPVLAHWPAGLVLRLTLHGDVVADAEVEHLAHGTPSPDDPLTRAARLLDAAASVLTLAGLPGPAARALLLRDACLVGDGPDAQAVAALADRVRRQRILRWVVEGLALTDPDDRRVTLRDHLLGLFDRAQTLVDGAKDAPGPAWVTLDALPALVRGQELAAVRLWMAALSVDLTSDRPTAEVTHG